jgi:hypothetical protein
MKFTPNFFSEHEHLLPGYKLQGVGTLSSPCLYSDLHAGVPAATLFLLRLFYVRISVVRGDMDPSRVSTSRIEFLEILDVPRVLLRFSILVFQAHTSLSDDMRHSVWSFPLWGELMTGGVLLPMEDKISRMELLGTDASAVIPTQPLQLAGGPHYCPAMDLLKEVDIIKTLFSHTCDRHR